MDGAPSGAFDRPGIPYRRTVRTIARPTVASVLEVAVSNRKGYTTRGAINRKVAIRLKRIYEQAPKPCVVIAIGNCPCSMDMFKDSYNTVGPLDKIIPVDAYIPGCPPKPEAMIMGVVKLVKKLRGQI